MSCEQLWRGHTCCQRPFLDSSLKSTSTRHPISSTAVNLQLTIIFLMDCHNARWEKDKFGKTSTDNTENRERAHKFNRHYLPSWSQGAVTATSGLSLQPPINQYRLTLVASLMNPVNRALDTQVLLVFQAAVETGVSRPACFHLQ
jgi:hypothetical protein